VGLSPGTLPRLPGSEVAVDIVQFVHKQFGCFMASEHKPIDGIGKSGEYY
jgi:hypothetical protein